MKKIFLITTLLITLSVPTLAMQGGNKVYADVNGLICDFCARALEKVFGQEETVESIDVNMDAKVVTIHFKEGEMLDNETITQLILNAGYDVREIRRDAE